MKKIKDDLKATKIYGYYDIKFMLAAGWFALGVVMVLVALWSFKFGDGLLVMAFGLFGLFAFAFAVRDLLFSYGFEPEGGSVSGQRASQGQEFDPAGFDGSEFELFSEYEHESEEGEEAEPVPASPGRSASASRQEQKPLSREDLKQRRNFYAFIYGVTIQNKLGQGTWQEQGVSQKTYEGWLNILKKAGVVMTRPGARPIVQMTFEEALEAVALAGGEIDYWKPVVSDYVPNASKSSLLIMEVS